MDDKPVKEKLFTSYEVFLIVILALLQFTVILDFMVLSPLSAVLLPSLNIKTSQFGLVVSVYAFSAGISGVLAAGFADRFDRKKFLLFFYVGFIAGTFLCSIASNYHFLLIARIVTGLFGGVLSSVTMAIVADLFPMKVRGRVMGFVQMAFAASQVLGIPIGLYLANQFNWHAPFWMLVGFGIVLGAVIFFYMKPVTSHLRNQTDRNPFHHLFATLSKPQYLLGFGATTLLSTGAFMIMPFGSAFATNNLGIPVEKLPLLYGATGLSSLVFGPLIGKYSDRIGKFNVFWIGSVITMIMVFIYTNLQQSSLAGLILINILMFVGVLARIISSSSLTTAIPALTDRGAYMSINSSVQQVSGGIGAAIAGLIVAQTKSGYLLHYDILGFVVMSAMLLAIVMMYFVNRMVQQKMKAEG